MGVVELISKGFQIATKSKGVLAILFAFGFIWNLINIPFTQQPGTPIAGPASLVVDILSIVFIAVSIYMQAGSLTFVRELIKTGKPDLANFKNGASKFYLRILGISAVVGLYIVILSILAALCILLSGESPNPISVALAVLIAIVGFVGILMVFLSPYILVADDAKVIESIRSSVRIVKANFLKILALGVLLILIGFGIGVLLGMVFGLIGNVIKGLPSQILFSFISSLLNAYIGLVVSGTFMSYYLSYKQSEGTTQVS